METIKQKVSGKFGFVLLTGALCLTVGILFLLTQKTHTQNVSNENRNKAIEKEIEEQRKMFYKTSSTQTPVDEGNRIVAVRRIKLHFEDFDKKGFSFGNQKDLIEIEVFSKLNIPVTNSAQYLIIGDMVFSSLPSSADGHTIFAHMSKEEFNKTVQLSVL